MATRKIKVIQKFKKEAIGIQCNFCKGKGAAPQSDLGEEFGGPCPVCKGKGLVIFRKSLDNLTPCNYCNSTGRHWDETGDFVGHFTGGTCEVCKGTGVIVLKFDLSDIEEFDMRALHSEVVKHGRELFIKRQWYYSVFEVCKAFEEYVQKVSELGAKFTGYKLMSNAFSKTGPLFLSSLDTQTVRSQQDGLMHLAMGVMMLFRNPISHKPAREMPIKKQEALEILTLFSLLYRKIDTAQKRKKTTN